MKNKTAVRQKALLLATCVLFMCMVMLLVLKPEPAGSAPYTASTHGDSIFGANRGVVTAKGYSKGNCAHCHLQHASIDETGASPIVNTPNKFELFYQNYVNQTDGICLKCHDNTTTVAGTAVTNHSYSFRAGGYSSGAPANDIYLSILQAFSYNPTTPSGASSHDLTNIRTFITGKAWNYTADSNPCAACHNPHMDIGDPENVPNSPKSSLTRQYAAIARPSRHRNYDTGGWGIWGTNASERMNSLATSLGGMYQAPYFNPSNYEPDGSTTQNGSNMVDMVTFCTDCHNATDIVNSTPLGRNLYRFSWLTGAAADRHGGGLGLDNTTAYADVFAPYADINLGQYVLACTDCHEPHGSPNNYLIRKQVNNGVVTVTQYGAGNGPLPNSNVANKEWVYLCGQCHTNLGTGDAHTHPTVLPNPPIGGTWCAYCHPGGGGTYRNCQDCHFHGNGTIDGVAFGRQLF